MSGRLRVALAQVNAVVGDIEGNALLIAQRTQDACDRGAQLVAFPELALTGYPPEDLLFKEHFVAAGKRALDSLADRLAELPAAAVIGCVERDGDRIFNALAVVHKGAIVGRYRKMLLPNYGVFDEKRYFEPGSSPALLEINGVGVGLTICEDIWERNSPPMAAAAASGAAVLLNISASPYHRSKGNFRGEMLAARARDHDHHVALCALVGGQDELVFDGESLVVSPEGETVARGSQFEQDLVLFEIAQPQGRMIACVEGTELIGPLEAASAPVFAPSPPAVRLDAPSEVYAALVTGLRDYTIKNGFEHVVFGLSGGIDSALTACIACDALGAEHVSVVVMPSPHSSDETQSDARQLARNLGAECFELPIGDPMAAFESLLSRPFANSDPDITEENLQARIRGNLVMALSNKFGWLALSTGNKSEYSVGYTTLYGDMAGGFAVLKDVPKTLVFELSRWRNTRDDAPIPVSTIERPPSAELRPDQRDTDSLPPYDVLDGVLELYVERDLGRDAIVAAGFDVDITDRVIALVDRSEYKRRQAPPGVKITPKAFGRDRRMPITNRFSG